MRACPPLPPRHHTLALVATLALYATGCPQEEPAPVSPSPDLGAADMATEDMREVDAGPDQGADQAVDQGTDQTGPSWSARLEAVDWGLLPPGEPLPAPVTFTLAAVGADVYEGRVVWPAGVWRLVVEDGGKRRLVLESQALTGLGREADPLVEAADGGAPQLSAAPEEVTVRVQAGAATIRRVVTQPEALPWDAGREARPALVGDLFDDALYAINTNARDPYEVTLWLMDQLYARGAGPVVVSRGQGATRYLLLAPGADDEPAPQVRGSFTGWEARPAGALRKLSGRLWGRFVDVPDGQAAYKLVLNNGAAWFTDPSNRHIEWDGINPNNVGAFNSVLGEPALGVGRMVWLRSVESPQLQNKRDVYIRLPARYDANPAERYPVLYVHDGNESIVRSQLHEVADGWERAETGRGVILAFVALPTQLVRIEEYTMASQGARGDQYSDFIAQTLVARVDGAFRTRAARRGRGVVGASLGGLISYWIGMRHPATFEYVAGMSSSFWWAERFMIAELERRGCQGLRYYLDSGTGGASQDGAADTRLMRDKLDALGCDYTHVEQAGATHDWAFWKERFGGVLDAFEQTFKAP